MIIFTVPNDQKKRKREMRIRSIRISLKMFPERKVRKEKVGKRSWISRMYGKRRYPGRKHQRRKTGKTRSERMITRMTIGEKRSTRKSNSNEVSAPRGRGLKELTENTGSGHPASLPVGALDHTTQVPNSHHDSMMNGVSLRSSLSTEDCFVLYKGRLSKLFLNLQIKPVLFLWVFFRLKGTFNIHKGVYVYLSFHVLLWRCATVLLINIFS